MRRSRRQVFKFSSQAGVSVELPGPKKNTALGGGGSVKFITPVWETRSCRGFHSSANNGSFAPKLITASNNTTAVARNVINAYLRNLIPNRVQLIVEWDITSFAIFNSDHHKES